jgi:hypothetical protein
MQSWCARASGQTHTSGSFGGANSKPAPHKLTATLDRKELSVDAMKNPADTVSDRVEPCRRFEQQVTMQHERQRTRARLTELHLTVETRFSAIRLSFEEPHGIAMP